MVNGQTSIHSGFGPRTTAKQAIESRDLSGLTAIVTGGHSGLGLETARALADAGARVVVAARRPAVAREAAGRIAGVEVRELDLSDLDSVRSFAEAFVESGRHADIVINNAGIMACPETRVGPGWEAQFATNHLGHYALVNLLWPALVGGARVIAVSSAGHHNSAIRWDGVQFERGYDRWLAYGQSKTANALFAVQMDVLGRGAGVRAFSLHPGKILTPLQRHMTNEEMIAAGWIDEGGDLADPTFKTPEQGAATSAQLAGMGGLYCEDCDVARLASDDDEPFVGVRRYATDPEQARRLWWLSSELTGIDAFADHGSPDPNGSGATAG